jgi:hypothetical protein
MCQITILSIAFWEFFHCISRWLKTKHQLSAEVFLILIVTFWKERRQPGPFSS